MDRATARARGVARDAEALGGRAAAAAAYDGRYLAACALYEAEVQPALLASLVVDNTDLTAPRIP